MSSGILRIPMLLITANYGLRCVEYFGTSVCHVSARLPLVSTYTDVHLVVLSLLTVALSTG